MAAHGGQAVKYEADNLIAVFESSRDAALAAIAIQAAVGASDAGFTVAIGIDVGELVLVESRDLYGDPVNIACKLGEDLARPGEVLLTAAARAGLGPDFPHALEEQSVSVSGLEFIAWSVRPATRA